MKLFLVSVLLGCLATPAAAQDITAVSWTGTVYSLNGTSGTGVFVGNSGFGTINNMAKSPGGTFYACSGYGGPSTVVDINPTTGVGTAISTTTLNSVRGMAYMGNTLYAINDSSGTGIGLDDLYTLNPITGTATYIGSTGYSGVQAITAANGVLYGWEIGSGSGVGVGLIMINTATGAATDVNSSIGNSVSVQALCTSPSGEIYGVQNSLYKISTVDGSSTLIGTGGYNDVRGAEFNGSGSPSFTLSKSGTCPGPVVLSSVNGTPNGAVVVLSGNAGSTTKPLGVCAGITVPISNPTKRAILSSNSSGAASFGFNTSAFMCGSSIVFVDVSSCTSSNAVVL